MTKLFIVLFNIILRVNPRLTKGWGGFNPLTIFFLVALKYWRKWPRAYTYNLFHIRCRHFDLKNWAGGTTLPGSRVRQHSRRVRGWVQLFFSVLTHFKSQFGRKKVSEAGTHRTCLNYHFPSVKAKNTVKFRYLKPFLKKVWIFAYFTKNWFFLGLSYFIFRSIRIFLKIHVESAEMNVIKTRLKHLTLDGFVDLIKYYLIHIWTTCWQKFEPNRIVWNVQKLNFWSKKRVL